jgi:hypothetical protein
MCRSRRSFTLGFERQGGYAKKSSSNSNPIFPVEGLPRWQTRASRDTARAPRHFTQPAAAPQRVNGLFGLDRVTPPAEGSLLSERHWVVN